MFPFWLWPYPGRLISAVLILALAYFALPNFLTYDNALWIGILAYVAGHWVWYYYRKYFTRRIIAFDVGGVIAQGDYFTETVRPMPGMYQTITEIRKSYVTAVLSNNNRMADHGFRQTFKSDDMFDVVYYSSDLGSKKPDTASFKKFAAKMGVSPSEIVFFDDDASNVEAAQKVGFNAHVFKSASQVVEVVKGGH
jgi:HAD superfamily hydrolase (TIGR01509 family)